MPWPNNVQQLPAHASINTIVEDPNRTCPDTQVVKPSQDTLEWCACATREIDHFSPLNFLCAFSLPILVHNIPTTGTKSRVDSAVTLTLDLVRFDATSTFERVGSYKRLLLPDGTTYKSLDTEQLKRELFLCRCIPSHSNKFCAVRAYLDVMVIWLDDTLYLSVAVQCGSEPYNIVNACTLCQSRERKMMERYPSRARNATALADKESNCSESSPRNLANPVVFVGAPLRDFANGRVRLKFRVTCYSSHHNDSLGFRYAHLRN